MQLEIVNSKSFMNFSVGNLEVSVKLVQVEILKLIICSATSTGMLVKRALTSNETKVSSRFIERCVILWMKSVLSLPRNEIFATVILKNFN